jgi:hypothetical protein
MENLLPSFPVLLSQCVDDKLKPLMVGHNVSLSLRKSDGFVKWTKRLHSPICIVGENPRYDDSSAACRELVAHLGRPAAMTARRRWGSFSWLSSLEINRTIARTKVGDWFGALRSKELKERSVCLSVSEPAPASIYCFGFLSAVFAERTLPAKHGHAQAFVGANHWSGRNFRREFPFSKRAWSKHVVSKFTQFHMSSFHESLRWQPKRQR